MKAWVNGRLLDGADDPALSVLDHGFTVGDGVFETVKVVSGRPFALTRHLARLGRSAAGLGLAVPPDAEVRAAVDAVLAGARWELTRLRITVTAGIAPPGSGRGDAGPTLAVVAGPMDPWPESTAVVTVPWPRNDVGAVAGLKTTSYAENVVALARAAEHDAGEAIFPNTRGQLCEGTGSNVFYVVDGELRTPTLGSGCLAGVTRALVLEWYGAVERDEPISVLRDATEIFLASTTRDVQGVRRCDDRQLEAPGPVTRKVRARWAEESAKNPDP
ncbi:MAG: 4-amino-4-deoxychorismate lyase [Propionibacteriales bacterium]|nr:4-amino-4-deoxychorismate lyase [Propionibacteriales bacterium]